MTAQDDRERARLVQAGADDLELTAGPPAGQPAGTPERSAAATQIRGSSILLVGRVLSMVINFGVLAMITRYLDKSTFGAFAYALSLVSLGESIVTFGLDRAVTRFVPIYEEQGAYNKLFGTLVMVTTTIVGLGLSLCLLVFGLRGWLAGSVIDDPQAVTLLVILIVLAPLHALDDLLMGMFAVFAQARAIFFRRHVLGPGFRLVVVLLLVLGESGVTFLATGYVAAGVVGAALYVGMLFRLLRRRGLLARFDVHALDFPFREVLSFTVPLLTSDLVYSVMNTSDAILLERFSGTAEVAAFRAVQPAARLNQVVFTGFTLLFTPLAARLFARDDREGINDLYWKTAIWLAVFSFPVFSLTTSLAHPITVTLYGERYESSAVILALLSLGYYFNAALGFNGLTLKVYGALRYIVTLNLAAAVLNIVLNLLLIPSYGALGAAVGTSATLVAHNVFKQIGLRRGTGISLFERRYAPVYGAIVVAALALWLVQTLAEPPGAVGVALAAVASIAVLRVGRSQLDVAEVFPEVLRLPVIGRLLR